MIEIQTAHLILTSRGAFVEPSSLPFAYQTSKKQFPQIARSISNSLSGSPKEAVKYGLSHYQTI
jgi:hypothetical protein